ncbi:hypothetical protein F4782DRAFT_536271 [Xylaria castorea]|nr:hypothetical protein F4782DRAFT_536271 [Xylaria castorea]
MVTTVNRLRSRLFKADQFAGVRPVTNQCGLGERARDVANCILGIIVRNSLDAGASALATAVKREFPANKGANHPPSDEKLRLTLEFIRSIACLSRAVEEPEDVPRLYKGSYRTVRQITQDTRQEFALQDSCIPIAARKDGGRGHDSGASFINSVAYNNLTDIFQLEDASCKTCCSATGLSAYFADLITFLSSTSCKPMYARSLLDVLTERRPDLKKQELTCANSQIRIPHIALVNETLESFIKHSYKGAPALTASLKHVFNTPTKSYDS